MSKGFQNSLNGAYDNPQTINVSEENINEGIRGEPRRRQSSLLRVFLNTFDRRRLSVISNVSNPEVVPKIEFYRSSNTFSRKWKRPDIEALQSSINFTDQATSDDLDNSKSDPGANKLGWINGVYIRTMMNLFGVMLFLRMGWMAGQAGILLALAQILIATFITSVTTLSMIALCTNGNIGGGGIYAMISRSVGHEAGGVIGFLFTFTNAAFVGLNLLGTAESVSDIMNVFGVSICGAGNEVNDQRIVGYICLIIIATIPLISLEFEAKTLLFFFFTLIISLVDYFIGAVLSPNDNQMTKGFASFKSYIFTNNLYPRWDGFDFFAVFGVFFPSVTGIFTGASMSADLKDPATAIPKGTFLAIATTSITYAIIIVFTGSTVVAYSSGSADDILYNNKSCGAAHCPYGLINDYQSMSMSGALSHTSLKVDPFIYAGIFAATLSSALGCYTAAPRIFMAFANDNLIPFISWFGKGYGQDGSDPRHGYIITFIIASVFIAIGDVNAAGVWISNFYLGAFFMVNFSLFHVSWVNSLSFRPSFRFYNKYISLLVGLVCLALMFLFDVLSGAVVCGLTVLIYISMTYVNPNKANWGPSTEEQFFNIARTLTYRLNAQEDHVKHYRPMILCLSGNPTNRRALVDMADHITKRYGLLFLGHIVEAPLPHRMKEEITLKQKTFLRSENINAFYKLLESDSLSVGTKSLIQASGVGKFTPNIVMLGYKTDWQTCDESIVSEYYDIIRSVFEYSFSLIIFRLKEGHDLSTNSNKSSESRDNFKRNIINSGISLISKTYTSQTKVNDFNDLMNLEPSVDPLANRFQTKQKKGFIDVWWPFDDGGLSILIPYILQNNSLWKGCQLRVFSIIKKSSEIKSYQNSLKELLNKFRISISAVNVLSVTDQPPKDETKKEFIKLMSKSVSNEQTMESLQTEMSRNANKTNRNLRLRELMVEQSSDSTLVVMTLPVPRNGIPVQLYMGWIEILTKDMPPFLLIRGNQSNVLTFYC